jgi:hypothetical protein
MLPLEFYRLGFRVVGYSCGKSGIPRGLAFFSALVHAWFFLGNEMIRTDYLSGYGAVRLMKFGDLRGDKVIPFYCKNCGYIELYNEKNLR